MAKSKSSSTIQIGGVPIGAVLAEFIGTFMLAFAVVASVNGVLAPFIPTPVIAGFSLLLAVLAIGGISGANINPAVTISLWSIKEVSTAKAVVYIIAQVAGASLALMTLVAMLESVDGVDPVAGDTKVFLAEALGAAIFTYGIAAAVRQKLEGIQAAVLIGGSLFMGILFAITVSAGVLNPAVAVALNATTWDYLLGSIVGGVLGMNIFAAVYENRR